MTDMSKRFHHPRGLPALRPAELEEFHLMTPGHGSSPGSFIATLILRTGLFPFSRWRETWGPIILGYWRGRVGIIVQVSQILSPVLADL